MVKTAVILCAGRGSRMCELTESKPKCLVKLDNISLLDWQISALKQNGIERIIVVRGYKSELISGNFETVDNHKWESSNMVRSMLCAYPLLDENESFILSYSDIVYKPLHIKHLLNSEGDISITYDRQWESLWRLRNQDPLIDAETFQEEGGILKEIGNKTHNIDDIRGQYMGLLKFTPVGRQMVSYYLSELSELQINKLDMTGLLKNMLKLGNKICAVPVDGGWCEVDTKKDLQIYSNEIIKGNWDHDWR